MSKKFEFVKYVQKLMENQKENIEMNEDAHLFWEALLVEGEGEGGKPKFTDNGKLIMKYLQDLPEGNPMMKARDIAEGMGISSRTVSGSIRKLVSDGFIEKMGESPVMYSLTEAGKTVDIEENN